MRPFRKEKRLINATSPSSGKTSSASEAPLSQRLGRRLLRYGISAASSAPDPTHGTNTPTIIPRISLVFMIARTWHARRVEEADQVPSLQSPEIGSPSSPPAGLGSPSLPSTARKRWPKCCALHEDSVGSERYDLKLDSPLTLYRPRQLSGVLLDGVPVAQALAQLERQLVRFKAPLSR